MRSGLFGLVGAELFRLGFAGLFQQDFDLLLGLLESRLAAAGQHDAALEGRERLLQRQVTVLQALDEFLEIAHRGLEIQRL